MSNEAQSQEMLQPQQEHRQGSEEAPRNSSGDAFFSMPPRDAFYVLLAALVATTTLTVLHIAALAAAWYWRVWWFDWVMHLLGGIALALLIVWGWMRLPWGPHRWWGWSLGMSIAVGLGAAMLVWEVGEYIGGVVYLTEAVWEPYPVDTAIDIALGALGGLLVWRALRDVAHAGGS